MVLDTTFLIDYADGVEATREYLDAHADAVFATPAPAYTEFLVGPVHDPSVTVDLDEIEQKLSWVEVVETDLPPRAASGRRGRRDRATGTAFDGGGCARGRGRAGGGGDGGFGRPRPHPRRDAPHGRCRYLLTILACLYEVVLSYQH